ncbi:unnamed protein product (macronuclear) [Paramecium tetraurelia]|uniref:RBR-type E3 ubiquitin transferase n=1 Tax=Paramecium tetraurelia TaxID=5888 RepID=A0C2Z0_PARTE|nr:uncharacterized protein GSPATT00034635001 [Paramecium tetraurelia]CAK65157.1 unnamed protein product [Paramecium tetraurelia]|eukprot:XP_001432554.1 hypothetical protein (macronuclear) [Paramecium tetraurelia strain d4-2]
MDHMEQLCQSEQQKPQYQQLVLPIYQQQLFVSHGPKLGRSVQLKCKGFDQVDSHQSGDPNYHQISQNQQSFNGKTVHSQMQSMVSQEIKTEGLKVLVTEEARQKKIILRGDSGLSWQSELRLEIKPEEQSKESKDLQECQICYVDKPKEQFIAPLNCKHDFCSDCLSQHLTQNILKGNVLSITCPQTSCTVAFNDEQIKGLVQEKIYEKYKRFYNRQVISQNKNVRWCPKPDCENYVIGNGNDLLTCICGQSICFQCGNQYHKGMNCIQAMDAQYLQARKDNLIFDCPSCKAPIQKKGGCNHMTCYKCKYQFCWLCRGKYSSYHYVIFNVFGCVFPGGQGSNLQPFKNPMLLRVMMIIPKILLTIVLVSVLLALLPFFLMYLIVAAPYELSRRLCGFRLRRYRLGGKIGFGILYFFLGVLLSPLTVAIAILVSPCFLIFYLLDNI